MKYTKEEKKSLKFLTDKRDEAYGLMQFEDGEIYQLAEEEFNNYLTIEEIIDKQQKEIEEKDKQIKILDEAYSGAIKESKKWFDIAKDSIPKEVIRKMLEDFKKIPKLGIFESKEPIIRVLKEILGE